MSSRIY